METTVSLKEGSNSVENSLLDLQKDARDYRQMVENTRASIVSMENSVCLAAEDTFKSLMPQISELMSDMQREIKNVAGCSQHIQQQITELKKEKSVIQQHIIASNTRGQILEDTIGIN